MTLQDVCKDLYNSKLVSAEEAVKHVKSGSRVVTGHACAEPKILIDKLVGSAESLGLENVEVVHMLPMSSAPYAQEGMEKHFRHNAIFVGKSTRKPIAEGRADFTTTFFHKVPELFRKGYLKVDVALVQVSKPDKFGNCSLGLSVDYTKAAVENADLVIAQVNEHMPRTLGGGFLNIKDIDYLVEHNEPLIELQPPKIGEVEKAIGENCAKLVEDGSTLQLGIGAIPDAVLLFLTDKKDLGIHSEMISDGVLDLIEKGVITNNNKTLNKNKSIVTFLMGTKKLYDFVHDNPQVEVHPVDYVNNPVVVAQNNKLVCINSCVQVDFTGQVCSESVGSRQISGVGGQVDFVRGASMSEDGKSIMAIPSTAGGGKVSRIVPFLDHGAVVTTSRNDVEYVVTEYGIAQLKGKTLKERGRELIKISHPQFRDDLIANWEKMYCTKF